MSNVSTSNNTAIAVGDVFLSDLDGPSVDDSFIDSTATDSISTETPKKGKGANYSSLEDQQLVVSWLAITQDPIFGNEQKGETFWSRILEEFKKGDGFSDSARTVGSLANRWSTIQGSVNKFHGFYNQLLNKNQSGKTEVNHIDDAHTMYAAIMKKKFGFLPLWNILRNAPKWQAFTQCQKKTKPKRSATPTPIATPLATPIRATDSPTSPFSSTDRPLFRPDGRKLEKRAKIEGAVLEKIANNSAASASVVSALVDESKKKSEIFKKGMAEMVENAGHMVNNAVMLVDIQQMDPDQQEYYLIMRRRALKCVRALNTPSSENATSSTNANAYSSENASGNVPSYEDKENQ